MQDSVAGKKIIQKYVIKRIWAKTRGKVFKSLVRL